MNQKHKLVGLFRTIYYLPSVIAGVSVALLWSWVFHPDFGVINVLLYDLFHIQGPKWLFDPNTALASIIIMSLWSVGGSMLIYLGGLQGVPSDLYDAAEVDGAGALRQIPKCDVANDHPGFILQCSFRVHQFFSSFY